MNLKTQHKVTVGLTGAMLSGKSTALAVWRQAGAYVLSCDELLREIFTRPAVQKKIKANFGTTRRADVAQMVFSRPSARRKLEQILHPLLLKEIRRRLRASAQVVRVVEVPLLFEAHWENFFDLTITLVTPEKERVIRAKKRGFTRTDLQARSRAQLPQDQKALRADICLFNQGTEKQLARKVQVLQNALLKMYTVK